MNVGMVGIPVIFLENHACEERKNATDPPTGLRMPDLSDYAIDNY